MVKEAEIEFYGHACVLIRANGVTIVTDPWFSKTGAFLASWFQFPDNTGLDLGPIREADFIAISHGHEDHFDKKFLKTISPHTKIIIPRYESNQLYKELRELIPNEIISAPTRETIKLGNNLTITPVVQSVPAWEDSAFIFETPLGTVADTNDLKVMAPDLEWIKKHFSVDYLFAQFSGASWHPHVYNYSDEAKIKKAREKVKRKFDSVRILAESLGVRYLIPSAGPACFLDPEYFPLNFSEASTFPDQREFYAYAKEQGFSSRIAVLLPGDTFDPTSNIAALNEKNTSHPAFLDKKNYLIDYQKRRLDIIQKELADIPEPTEGLTEKCQDYFKPLVASSPFFQQQINGLFLIETMGHIPEKLIVDFTTPNVFVRPLGSSDSAFYQIKTEAKFLNLVLDKKLNWESLFLGMRFAAKRIPDEYNEHFTVFLKLVSPAAYRRYEQWERQKRLDQTFELEHGGKKYKVQRYCPHALADLSKGQIVDGNLICPGHGWQFSLKDGCCMQNKSKINVCDNENLYQEQKTNLT